MLFNSETKVWELVSDSVENPEILLEDIVANVVEFMKDYHSFSGTPAELAEALKDYCKGKILPNVLSKRLIQNKAELENLGIEYTAKRSNGKRLISLSMGNLKK